MKTAVLIISFNRPELLKSLLSNPEVNSRTVYLSIDGARNGILEDIKLVEACKKIASDFKSSRATFKTELKFQDTNKGISKSATEAIDWAFQFEEKIIVLEDDIFPSKDFFVYMDYYLNLFQLDKKIWHVGGHNPNPRTKKSLSPYLSIFPMMWGWGTWKDRWTLYDANSVFLNEPFSVNLHGYIPHQILNAGFTKYWENRILRIRNGFNTWDVQWGLLMWSQRAFAILPNVNLALNKGIGSNATNTKSATVFTTKKNFSGQELRVMPVKPIRNEWEDIVTWKYVFGRSYKMSIKWRIYIKIYKKLLKLNCN